MSAMRWERRRKLGEVQALFDDAKARGLIAEDGLFPWLAKQLGRPLVNSDELTLMDLIHLRITLEKLWDGD
jgi:hypothetical protein